VTKSTLKINSPNLELSSSQMIKNVSIKKKINMDDIPEKQKQKSLTIFKQLIIITSIVFSFGGFGFGFALRYGHHLEISQSNNSPLNNISENQQ